MHDILFWEKWPFWRNKLYFCKFRLGNKFMYVCYAIYVKTGSAKKNSFSLPMGQSVVVLCILKQIIFKWLIFYVFNIIHFTATPFTSGKHKTEENTYSSGYTQIHNISILILLNDFRFRVDWTPVCKDVCILNVFPIINGHANCIYPY